MIQDRLNNQGKIGDEYRLKFIQEKKAVAENPAFASLPFE